VILGTIGVNECNRPIASATAQRRRVLEDKALLFELQVRIES